MRKGLHVALLGALLLLCVSSNCGEIDGHHSINFKNQSERAIYVSCRDLQSRQDTIAKYGFPLSLEALRINANETNNNSLLAYSWESVLQYPSDTLMVYVFDAAMVESQAAAPEAVIARYDVTLRDLKRNHWLLSYPPNGLMDDIRMWPPYSSYNQTK